jgi:hypothetical protein
MHPLYSILWSCSILVVALTSTTRVWSVEYMNLHVRAIRNPGERTGTHTRANPHLSPFQAGVIRLVDYSFVSVAATAAVLREPSGLLP